MKFWLVTVLALSLVIGVSTSAVGLTLTLDDCIEQALLNRSAIIAARGSEDLAKAGKRAALGAFLPRLNATYDYSKTKRREITSENSIAVAAETTLVSMDFDTVTVYGASIRPTAFETMEFELPDQDLTSKSFRVGGSMSLVNLPTWFNLAGAGANANRAHLDVIAEEQDMILSVKVAYYAYLAAAENVDVQAEAVRRSEEQFKLIESRYELGSAARSDVLKQRVRMGNDRLSLISAENAVVKSHADLAYTVGLDPSGDYEFSTDHTPRRYDGSMEDAITFGLGHQPRLLSAEKSLDAAGHYLRSAKSQYLPTLGGFGNMNWSDGTQGDTVLYNSSSRSLTYGLSAQWNIFDGFQRERDVAQAKISRNNYMAGLSDLRNQVILQTKKAFLDINKTNTQLEVSQETVEAATEDMRLTQEKYDLGAATILDLLESQVSLKTAQVSLISAGFDHNLAVARLENAMGKM